MRKLTHDIDLDIAVAPSSHSLKWKNTRTTWQGVAESLEETTRTDETVRQYLGYSKDRQDEIKDVGGFVGGKLAGGKVFVKKTQSEVEVGGRYGIRRKGHVLYRQLVALDVDFGTLDVWLDFINLNAAGLVYSTHKHKPKDPRLRIVFPLDRPVTPDEYEAIARQVASWLGMDLFDDTTYQPTRLMYYPSTSKDGEYVFDVNDAPVMCADEVLGEMDDPTDPTTWPRSSREDATRPRSDKQLDDPTLKDGVIGAFCRAYTVDEAIAEFLDEVYTPCEELGPDRYTYVLGSTAGGLVVYDGLFAYSHHATDPAGGKSCNAFDLVRLHKFGDLDERKRGADDDITKMPSYRAMSDFCNQLAPVRKELIQAKRASASEYDMAEEHARLIGEAADWVAELETEGKKGTIKNTINNVVLILHNDENLAGRLGFNEFEVREVALRPLPWDPKGKSYPRPLTDADDAQMRLYLERCYGITGRSIVDDGVKIVVSSNSYHPVRNYLKALEWDGEERLDTLFVRLFGVEDTEYMRAITRKSFTAAVARILRERPTKYDQVLVIVGEQRRGKSTVIDKMGGDWFSDSVTTIKGKEALESIQGAWLIEMGELAGMRKADIEDLKAFVAKKEDRFRVAYGKRQEYFTRRCVFFGTSNTDSYLRDDENTRFWTVNIRGCKGMTAPEIHEYFDAATRAQLWAEAKFRFEQGETLYLPAHLDAVAAEIADDHLDKDDRTGLVEEYIARRLPAKWLEMDPLDRRAWLGEPTNVGTYERRSVSVIEVWVECFGRNAEDIKFGDSKDVGKILRTIKGWAPVKKSQRLPHYGVNKVFTATGPKDAKAAGYIEIASAIPNTGSPRTLGYTSKAARKRYDDEV